MARSGEPREVERSIYFYRIDAGAGTDGIARSLDLRPFVERVEELPFKDGSRRYWDQRGGDAIALWNQQLSTASDRFTLAAVRRSSLPQSELRGELRELQLAAGAGLHEPIHVRLFPQNLVGVEFNFHGPRPTRLPLYFKHALRDTPAFTLEALLDQDSERRLRRQSEMRMLNLYIRPSYVAQVKDASSSLGDAFSAMEKLSKAQVLGLTLKPEPHQRTGLGKKILRGVKKLAGREDLAENVMTFRAKGVNEDSGRVETIDLLQDQLVSRRKIVTLGPNSRAVSSSAAFDAIEEAYEDLRDQIHSAAGIAVVADDDARARVEG